MGCFGLGVLVVCNLVVGRGRRSGKAGGERGGVEVLSRGIENQGKGGEGGKGEKGGKGGEEGKGDEQGQGKGNGGWREMGVRWSLLWEGVVRGLVRRLESESEEDKDNQDGEMNGNLGDKRDEGESGEGQKGDKEGGDKGVITSTATTKPPWKRRLRQREKPSRG